MYSGAVSYQFSPDTSLLVDAEYISRANVPSAPIPVRRTVVDGVTRNEDLATEIAGFNWYGPYELTQREVTTFDATFEHRFNSVWSLRAAANWFKRETEGRNNNIAGGVNPTYNTTGTNAGKLTGFVPGYGYAHETGYGAQIDLTAHYWLLNRVLENRTLLTFDYSDYTREDPQWRATASNAAAMAATGPDPAGRSRRHVTGTGTARRGPTTILRSASATAASTRSSIRIPPTSSCGLSAPCMRRAAPPASTIAS